MPFSMMRFVPFAPSLVKRSKDIWFATPKSRETTSSGTCSRMAWCSLGMTMIWPRPAGLGESAATTASSSYSTRFFSATILQYSHIVSPEERLNEVEVGLVAAGDGLSTLFIACVFLFRRFCGLLFRRLLAYALIIVLFLRDIALLFRSLRADELLAQFREETLLDVLLFQLDWDAVLRLARDEMDEEMGQALACRSPVGDENCRALAQVRLEERLGEHFHRHADPGERLRLELWHHGHVLLGQDEDMAWSRRLDVEHCHDLVILIELPRWHRS